MKEQNENIENIDAGGCFLWFLVVFVSLLLPFLGLFIINLFELGLEYSLVNYFAISCILGITIILFFVYNKINEDEDSNSI